MEYVNKSEILEVIDEIGGCDAADEYARGYDNAIYEAHSRIEKMKKLQLPRNVVIVKSTSGSTIAMPVSMRKVRRNVHR